MTACSGSFTSDASRAHGLKGRIARGETVHGIMAGDLSKAIHLGATDLSVSLGAPDLPPYSVPAAEWRRLGVTFLLLGHDTELFERGLRSAVSQIGPIQP
jgi:hypothetical protein